MSNKNPNRRIHQLSLDAEADRDIIEWLASKPKRRGSDAIRRAIRFYMAAEQGGISELVVSNVDENEGKPKIEKVKADVGGFDF